MTLRMSFVVADMILFIAFSPTFYLT